jgi:phasin family protein
MTMAEIPEPLVGLSEASVEAALRIAQVSMESAERMMRLQLDAAKTFVAEQAETANALAGAKDPQALVAVRARLAEKAVESALGYSRDFYAIAAQTQQQLSQMAGQRFAAYQQQMGAAMEKIIKAAPGGSEVAVEAVKSTLAAAQTALDGMAKAAQQAAELAEANVKAVTEAAANAVKATIKR